MTSIILESPLQQISKTRFKNEKEMVLYFLKFIDTTSLDFKELDKSEISPELLDLIEKSKQKDISEFDNI